MKSQILITVFIAISSLTFSQDYMDSIASKTCDCLNAVSDTLEPERYKIELGLCMIEAAIPYKKQLKKDYNINLDRIDTQGDELGRIIGLKMATVCPDALMKMAKKIATKKENEIPESIIEGYITKIEENNFVVFSLTDENGKVIKFYWLTFIEANLDLELTSQYKLLMNKAVRITFKPQEFFDFRIEEYRTFNIIQKIEILI